METRIKKIAQALCDCQADAIVLHGKDNRRYFVGFRSSAGTVVITREGKAAFAVDFRYITTARQALENSPMVCQLVDAGGEDAWIGAFLRDNCCKRVLVEEDVLSHRQVKLLESLWKVELADGSDILRQLRSIKSAAELTKVRASQQIAEYSLQQTFDALRPGMTEHQVEAYLTWRLLENGSENGIFGIVAASGPNSALPHAVPSNRELQAGDFLLIDFGAIYEGYYSDISRTVAIGHATQKMEQIYQLVLDANCAAINALRPGLTGHQVDAVARDYIAAAGYGQCFGHGLGHAVGLDIHESPRLRTGSKDLLQQGNIVTIEPGIYLPGEFGVRIEDLLYLTEAGCENLTRMSKELTVI